MKMFAAPSIQVVTSRHCFQKRTEYQTGRSFSVDAHAGPLRFGKGRIAAAQKEGVAKGGMKETEQHTNAHHRGHPQPPEELPTTPPTSTPLVPGTLKTSSFWKPSRRFFVPPLLLPSYPLRSNYSVCLVLSSHHSRDLQRASPQTSPSCLARLFQLFRNATLSLASMHASNASNASMLPLLCWVCSSRSQSSPRILLWVEMTACILEGELAKKKKMNIRSKCRTQQAPRLAPCPWFLRQGSLLSNSWTFFLEQTALERTVPTRPLSTRPLSELPHRALNCMVPCAGVVSCPGRSWTGGALVRESSFHFVEHQLETILISTRHGCKQKRMRVMVTNRPTFKLTKEKRKGMQPEEDWAYRQA